MASTVDRCHEALSRTDEVRLVALAADRSEWVRASVPLNPAAPRELLLTCLSDRSWRVVRNALAASLFVLPQVRRVLVADPDEDVRAMASRSLAGTEGPIRVDPFDLTEDDLMAEALQQPGFGAAAAVHFAATREHDRTADATRHRILSGQVSLPWPAQQGSVVDVAELHDVAIRTDVAGRPSWLADADDLMEQISSVLAELGGLLEDHHELDGDLVITASVPTSHTAQQVSSAVTASTNVTFRAQSGA